jgi:DNA-binding NtrC family response regulator
MTPQEIQPRTSVFLGMTAIIASEPMRRLMSQVERAARSSAAVLITGESGSGKELAARAVHHFSPRSHRPWVDLSCAALPEHLLESELFGYDRGAFSGADHQKPGLFEMAHQGTLFLDEIGELDPRMQVKLLRVLDGVPYYRLGGTKKVSADVRIVAATNQDLERMVAEGRFRGDLYHRLCQLTLRVPPLRERVEDVAPLAWHILEQHDPEQSFTSRALRLLESHTWPGNVRELRNVVMKAAVMNAEMEIDAEHLPLASSLSALDRAVGNSVAGNSVAGNGVGQAVAVSNGAASNGGASNGAGSNGAGANGANAHTNLDLMERRMIMDALAASGGHQQQAAARLGISRRTLSRKLKQYEAERSGAVV